MIKVQIYKDEKYPSYYISEYKNTDSPENIFIPDDVWDDWKRFSDEEDKWDEYWAKMYKDQMKYSDGKIEV